MLHIAETGIQLPVLSSPHHFLMISETGCGNEGNTSSEVKYGVKPVSLGDRIAGPRLPLLEGCPSTPPAAAPQDCSNQRPQTLPDPPGGTRCDQNKQ